MPQVGDGLWIKVGIDSSGLQKGLGEVTKSMTSWKDAKNADIRDLASWGTALTAEVAPVVALGLVILKTADAAAQFGDAISDTSYILGITTDETQRWRQAAVSTGTDFNNLTGVMQMYSQRVSESGAAGDSLRKSLSDIGVQVKDANGNWKDTSTLMWDTLTSLQNMPNAYERNNMAMAIYGRNWSSISDMISDANDAKAAFAGAETFTQEEIDRMEDYKVNLEELSGKWDHLTYEIGEKFIPFIEPTVIFMEDRVVPAFSVLADTLGQAERGFHLTGLASKRAFEMMSGQYAEAMKTNDEINSYIQSTQTSDALKAAGYTGANSRWDEATGRYITVRPGGGSGSSGTGGSGSGSGGGSGGGGTKLSGAEYGPQSPADWVASITPEQFRGMSGYEQSLAIEKGYNAYAFGGAGSGTYWGSQAAVDTSLKGVDYYTSLLGELNSSAWIGSTTKGQYSGLEYSDAYTAEQEIRKYLTMDPNSQEYNDWVLRRMSASGSGIGSNETDQSVLAQYMLGTGSIYNLSQSDLDTRIKSLLSTLAKEAEKKAAYEKAYAAGDVYNITTDDPLAAAAAISRLQAAKLNQAGIT